MSGWIDFKDPASIGIPYDYGVFGVGLAHVFCSGNFVF